MLPIGLNHMTVARASARRLVDVARQVGCVGIEVRNDLEQPLFDGDTPQTFAKRARDAGLRILALAEIKDFNASSPQVPQDAVALIETAAACGAEGVALIPQMPRTAPDRATQRDALGAALKILQPILEANGVRGLIEPLGFTNSSLRYKEDVVAVLDDMGRPACFALIHDTFHHHLAGGGTLYPELTAITHISGVTDPIPTAAQMTDAHRGLVDGQDRLDNIGQLRGLQAGGYTGPASFEAFAPATHAITDPATALAGSIAFIAQSLTAPAVGAA